MQFFVHLDGRLKTLVEAIDIESKATDIIGRAVWRDYDQMEEIFKITYQMAEDNRDFGLANFLAERQDAHAKHSWMLRSTLK